LKPLLYAAMLDDGSILPHTLVPDTPLNINGFTPHNYDKEFRGAVAASEAISRSLNVPLVRMLSNYNTGRFMSLLRASGMTTLRFSEDHYGAAIILGGAEGTLWDMAGMYGSMARVLNHFGRQSGLYNAEDIHPLVVNQGRGRDHEPVRSSGDGRLRRRATLSTHPTLSAAGIWSAFEAMSAVNRPEEEADWQSFASMKRVAWKTGTSYGSRDGWAVGVTPRYVVGVWTGNASGEGRAGLTGVGYAAPVMFDIFSLLPDSEWFETPHDELVRMAVCRRSGHKASAFCDLVDTLLVPRSGVETAVCPYHRLVHLSSDERWRVNSSCEDVSAIVTRSWFVLPPAQEFYYRSHYPSYSVLPPVRAGCREVAESIEVIYPEHGSEVFLPRGLSGEREQAVFSAAHSDRDALLFWYLDGEYAGQTSGLHRMSFSPAEGAHTLTLTDSSGNRRTVAFTVKK
jgi:penicillin-binding protein 1C